MAREAPNQRATAGLLVCLLVGVLVVMTGGGFSWLREAASADTLTLATTGLIVFMLCLAAAAAVFIPYGFVALGWLRLQKHESELAELPDDNTVGDPVEGERKYQQWLSAMNSTEAFLGMLPRSEPYVPPEQRAPEGAQRPQLRMSAAGKSIAMLGILLGAAAGAGLAGLGQLKDGSADMYQILVAAGIGMVFATPPSLLLGLIIGRVEPEEDDDAGTGDRQTT